MTKPLLAFVIAVLTINLMGVTSVAASPPQSEKAKPTKEEKRAAKTKELIAKMGTGPEARIGVELLDKTNLEGYVGQADDDHFVVTNEKTGAVTTVMYSQVKKIKLLPTVKTLLKKDLSSGRFFKRMAIAAGVVFGAVFVVCAATKGCVN